MTRRHLIAGCIALAAVASVSVASAAPVNAPAWVGIGSTAWRVDPPPYVEVGPDQRAAYELTEIINSYRRQNGLQPLVRHELVTLAATRHSEELSRRGTLSHVGLNGSTSRERLAAVGFDRAVGENLGSGFVTPQAIFDAWLASATHRGNLLLAFDYIGVGVTATDGRTPYWVVMIAADEFAVPI